MGDILTRINNAYKKGISDPRFQKAINEIIRKPEIERKVIPQKNIEGQESR